MAVPLYRRRHTARSEKTKRAACEACEASRLLLPRYSVLSRLGGRLMGRLEA